MVKGVRIREAPLCLLSQEGQKRTDAAVSFCTASVLGLVGPGVEPAVGCCVAADVTTGAGLTGACCWVCSFLAACGSWEEEEVVVVVEVAGSARMLLYSGSLSSAAASLSCEGGERGEGRGGRGEGGEAILTNNDTVR